MTGSGDDEVPLADAVPTPASAIPASVVAAMSSLARTPRLPRSCLVFTSVPPLFARAEEKRAKQDNTDFSCPPSVVGTLPP